MTLCKQFAYLTLLLLVASCGFDDRAGSEVDEVLMRTLPLEMLSPYDDVELTVYDTSVSQDEIDDGISNVLFKGVIDHDNKDLKVEIDSAKLSTGKYLLFEIKDTAAGTGKVFDPIKNEAVNIGSQVFHRFLKSGFVETENNVFRIDPYSEIAYQRTLVLAGLVDATERAAIKQWSGITDKMIEQAENEVRLTLLGGDATNSWFSALKTAEQLWVHPSSVAWYAFSTDLAAQVAYAQWVQALAHIKAFDTLNASPALSSPLVAFTRAASLDMLDGDYDGRSIWAAGSTGFVAPAVLAVGNTPAIPATLPTTAVAAPLNQTLPGDRTTQHAFRDAYVARLGAASTAFFTSYKNATSCVVGATVPTSPLSTKATRKAVKSNGDDWLLEGTAGANYAYCELKVTYKMEATAPAILEEKILRLDNKGNYSVKLGRVAKQTPASQPWQAANFVHTLQNAALSDDALLFVGLPATIATYTNGEVKPMQFIYTLVPTEGLGYYAASVGAGNYTNPFGVYDNPIIVQVSTNAGKIVVTGQLTAAQIARFGKLSFELSYNTSTGAVNDTVTRDLPGPGVGFTFNQATGNFTYETPVIPNLVTNPVAVRALGVLSSRVEAQALPNVNLTPFGTLPQFRTSGTVSISGTLTMPEHASSNLTIQHTYDTINLVNGAPVQTTTTGPTMSFNLPVPSVGSGLTYNPTTRAYTYTHPAITNLVEGSSIVTVNVLTPPSATPVAVSNNPTINVADPLSTYIGVSGTLTPQELSDFSAMNIQLRYNTSNIVNGNPVITNSNHPIQSFALPVSANNFTFNAATGQYNYYPIVPASIVPGTTSVTVEGVRKDYLIPLLGVNIESNLFGGLAGPLSINSRPVLDYFIGSHVLGTCKVLVKPTGDVVVNDGSTSITRNLGADIIDSLLRRPTASLYRLNIGDSTQSPAQYTILDIDTAPTNYKITKVTLGAVMDNANQAPDSAGSDLLTPTVCQ